MNSPKAGWFFAISATFLFSVAPPIARAILVAGLNPTAVLLVRMWITSLLLAATIAVMDRRLLWKDRRCFVIGSVAGLVNSVGMIAYFWALTRIDASIASMLFSASPLFVLSLLALRGEPITRRHLVRLALAAGGIYFLIGPGGAVDITGVLLIALSVLSFGGQVVIIQWYLRGYDARTVTLYMINAMSVVLTIFWLFEGMPWRAPSGPEWVAILVLAVVSTYLARLAFFAGVTRIGGGQASLLTPLEIFLTVLWSILFLGERLTAVQWQGGVLILASAALAVQRLGRVRLPLRWRLFTASRSQ